MALQREQHCALAAVTEAAELLHRFEQRRAELAREAKTGNELVTQADRALNDLLVARIHAAFSRDAICAEEGSEFDNARAARRWFIDPLDGTRSFMAGQGGYGILIGLVVEGTPRLGVIYDPATRTTVVALHKGGVTEYGRNNRRLGGLAHTPQLAWSPFSRPELSQPLAQSLGLSGVTLCESVGMRALALARGEAMVFGSGPRSPKLWDSAAAWVVVHELGGRYTDFDGDMLDYAAPSLLHERGAVASIGLDHHLVVATLRDALQSNTVKT